MIGVLRKKAKAQQASDALLAFVQAWDMHGRDEISIASSAIEVVRAYLGDRPCCVWRRNDPGFIKLSERGVVDVFVDGDSEAHHRSLTKTLASGTSDFIGWSSQSFTPGLGGGYEGFLNLPIKIQDDVIGVFSIGALKKEARDRNLVQPLECLGRLIAIAFHHGQEGEANVERERKLRAEVESTGRELAHTNNRLIERVRELKTLSKELEKRVEELTHANKAKDEFLSIVSHELRTPLTSLKGFLCVILDGEAGPITEAQKKFLNIAKQSADRLNVLISDLLDVSRIESGRLNLNMNVMSLHNILVKSVQDLTSLAQAKNIQINLRSNAKLPAIMGDAHRLQQVIDNILSNAIKFTQHDGIIQVLSEDRGDGILVSIKDTGPGISQDEVKKIFDMFYQVDASTRRNKGGAGLGLAIAHGIVSMHGGKLWVESEVGKGTDFRFVIPRHKAQKAA